MPRLSNAEEDSPRDRDAGPPRTARRRCPRPMRRRSPAEPICRRTFARRISGSSLVLPLATTTAADALVLELGARQLATVERYAQALATDGHVYRTATRYGATWRARPEVELLSRAQAALLATLLQLGLTPASRTRVDAVVGALSSSDPLEVLLRRRERAQAPA